ncbi:MAG: hypothetical protein AAFV93_03270, partial [Chloroflexota bacterium]
TFGIFAEGGNGDDTITVNGLVVNDVSGEGGNDDIIINGTVQDDVEGGKGEDNITINGTVEGDVTGGNDDDSIIISDDASINGMIDGQGGNDTLLFDMVICPIDGLDVDRLNNSIENSEETDTVRIGNRTFAWMSIENLESNIEETECMSVEEFFDGRIDGIQCPVFVNPNFMTVYDTSGEYHTTITPALLTSVPATRNLLSQNATGTARIFHMPDGQIQVECDVWDSFLNIYKTDIYVFDHINDRSVETLQ